MAYTAEHYISAPFCLRVRAAAAVPRTRLQSALVEQQPLSTGNPSVQGARDPGLRSMRRDDAQPPQGE
jgi:hypothetical protein